MINFKKEIAEAIAKVTNLDAKELENYLEIPPNSNLGDYAFPCFKLAKDLRKAPPMIANDIKENIEIDANIIERIDVVGGYLNIFINKETLIKTVLEDVARKNEKYGSSDIGQGKNVVIDYSAPNIAKPFHIGHLRSTVIGGALYKIYNFLGYNSVGINYLGDWGLQFGKVMAGISLWKDEYDFEKDEMASILKIYIRFNQEEKENPELTDLARKSFKKLEDRDQETVKLWEHIREISLENYQKTYKLLNSKFDSYNGEAYYNDKMDPVVDELKEKGLLKESQGAHVVDLEEYNMPPCIIITSAGTTIYATRDLASLKDRINKYNFDKAIYVVGNEQQLHFKQVFKVLELMGYEEYASKCEHVPFGLVVDKDGEKIGSRKGNSVFLEDILNEAIDKVKDIINEKNPDIEDKDEIARKVGVGAIIFNDLSNSRIKDEIFDWDMLLNFQGETGPYIQYIYVRTRSLLAKAGYTPKIEEVDFSKLNEKAAIETLKLIYMFNEVIESAADKNEPSILSRYLINLSQSFSTFYNDNKIITDDKAVQDARLFLTYAVGTVLKTGVELLGMEMPERM
jgi:arginyl-tRNA synthetase